MTRWNQTAPSWCDNYLPNHNLGPDSCWLESKYNFVCIPDHTLRKGPYQYNSTGIIDVCRGLSLNDSYWVVPEGFEGTFEAYNLYENRFSEILALVAYTDADRSHKAFTTSLELTTSGMLPKAWRLIEDDGIFLYKGGTRGASNSGREPYCEAYAKMRAPPYQVSYEDICHAVMGPVQKAQLHRMIGFKFHRYPAGMVTENHLDYLEKLLEDRVQGLLNIPNRTHQKGSKEQSAR